MRSKSDTTQWRSPTCSQFTRALSRRTWLLRSDLAPTCHGLLVGCCRSASEAGVFDGLVDEHRPAMTGSSGSICPKCRSTGPNIKHPSVVRGPARTPLIAANQVGSGRSRPTGQASRSVGRSPGRTATTVCCSSRPSTSRAARRHEPVRPQLGHPEVLVHADVHPDNAMLARRWASCP